MASAGTNRRIGPERGKLILRTSRQGIAAQAGHDLTIEVGSWSGAVVMTDEPADSTVEVTVDLGTLRVVTGEGGARPLSERDKREIAATARKLLDTDHQPRATFVSEKIQESPHGGVIAGRLALRGAEQPLELTVTALGEGRFRATGTVVQSQFGIRPYTALLGALRLADQVEVEAEVDLSEASR